MDSNLNGQFIKAKNLIEQNKNFIIALPETADGDSIAAACALYLALSAENKKVALISDKKPTVEFNRLIGVDRIKSDLTFSQGKTLIISFPYKEGSIEKVSYNIEEDRFNLVIEPREGHEQISPEKVDFSSEGSSDEIIITISANSLSDLGEVFNKNRKRITTAQIININNMSANATFGKVNVLDTSYASVSEIIMDFLRIANFKIEQDTAKNILWGISFATDNFTSAKVNAATFEAAAICMKFGAKIDKPLPLKEEKQRDIPVFVKNKKEPQKEPEQNQNGQIPQMAKPQEEIKPETKQPQKEKVVIEEETTDVKKTDDQQKKDTPPDWLKPKIYKGSSLL